MKVSQLLPSIRYEVEKPMEEKLRRAKELVHIFGGLARDKAAISCSFGKDSMVVLHLCLEEFPNIAVIFNNTGVQYRETHKFKERMREEWNLNLIETKPLKSFWQVAKEYGLPDGRKKSDRCCDYLKEMPYRKVVKEYGFKVCFTGITVLESRLRMFTACQRGQEYFSKKDGLTKIHPIMFWRPEEVLEFSRRVQIPVNPAYEKYSIDRLGCVPCTSHKYWREQMVKTNPRMYEFIQERFFGQKLLLGFEPSTHKGD